MRNSNDPVHREPIDLKLATKKSSLLNVNATEKYHKHPTKSSILSEQSELTNPQLTSARLFKSSVQSAVPTGSVIDLKACKIQNDGSTNKDLKTMSVGNRTRNLRTHDKSYTDKRDMQHEADANQNAQRSLLMTDQKRGGTISDLKNS